MKNQNYKTKNVLQERSFVFSKDVINMVSSLPNSKVYWVISDQLLRSATSVGANIIEAQAASSKRDFIKFFQIALKSSNETSYWLRLLNDISKSKKTTINKLSIESEELSKMLGASLLTMKGKRKL